MGADVFFKQLFVGAKAACSENRRTPAKLNFCAGLDADHAIDAAALGNQSFCLDVVDIVALELEESLLELGEGSRADVFFVNGREGDFTGLIELNSAGRISVDFDTAPDQPIDGASAAFRPRLHEIAIGDAFSHHEVIKLARLGARAFATGA